MSFYTKFDLPDEVMLEIGKLSVEEPKFVQFLTGAAYAGFFLEYPKDTKYQTKFEFEEIVRRRWQFVRSAWEWKKELYEP